MQLPCRRNAARHKLMVMGGWDDVAEARRSLCVSATASRSTSIFDLTENRHVERAIGPWLERDIAPVRNFNTPAAYIGRSA